MTAVYECGPRGSERLRNLLKATQLPFKAGGLCSLCSHPLFSKPSSYLGGKTWVGGRCRPPLSGPFLAHFLRGVRAGYLPTLAVPHPASLAA